MNGTIWSIQKCKFSLAEQTLSSKASTSITFIFWGQKEQHIKTSNLSYILENMTEPPRRVLEHSGIFTGHGKDGQSTATAVIQIM